MPHISCVASPPRPRHPRLLPPLLVIALAPSVAGAQLVTIPKKEAPVTAIGFGALRSSFTAVDADHPLPVTGGSRQEAFALATANAPAAAATAFGGNYVFAQSCSAYGSVALRVRGPDGGTMQPILTRTAADAAGGAVVSLGSGAVVDTALSGTTGCNATLTREP